MRYLDAVCIIKSEALLYHTAFLQITFTAK